MGSKRKRQAQETPPTAPPSKKQAKPEVEPEVPAPIIYRPFSEDPKGPHLKREVEAYEKLGSEDELERLEAANAVITGLFGELSVSEHTLLRHLERRLFRGLASGRKGARLGFSVVITEILLQLFGPDTEKKSKYAAITVEKLLGILSAKTKPEGDLSGQEERDHHLGLLFGLQCFVRSKILFVREDRKDWSKVFEMLISLAKKKPWIREECGWVIIEALEQMDQPTAEQTLVIIQQEGLASSPEGVGIWIRAKGRFPDMKFPSKPWGTSGNPLEHLKDLAKALKESSNPDEKKGEQQVKQTGNWNPQLHFVWKLVLDQYVQEGTDEDAQTSFEHFWKVAVDENLFSDNASPQRRYWGFLLFQRMLLETASSPDLQKRIFSSNLVRSLINHASQQDRYLNRAAVKSLKVMVQVAEAYPLSISTMIRGIVCTNGAYNFDRITKSKTIDGMLSFVNTDNADAVARTLLEPVVSMSTEEPKEAEARRQLFGDYLLAMVRRTNMSDDNDNVWVQNLVLPILADFAYSTKGHVKRCKPELTEQTRTLFKNRLSSAFAHVLSNQKGFSYPCELLKRFSANAITMDAGISEANDKAITTMNKLLSKLEKAGDRKKRSMQALALLYALMIFQLYNGDSDALSVLDELKMCYDKLIRGKESEDDVSEILVEILLSLISRPSKLLRKLGQLVFEAFSDDITKGGLALMTDVLESSESLKGQQDLFDQDDEMVDGDDDDGDNEDDDEDDEMDSDVEVVDAEEPDDGEDEDEDDDEDESGQSDTEENQKLDAALEAALGTHRIDKDTMEADDSDADMTDSEMLELDSKLVEIFREQKKSSSKSADAKKEKKNARENIINFKRSILDLLDIYVKNQPTKSFGLLVPLLTLIRTTTSKDEVAKNAHAVLNTYLASSKKMDAAERKEHFSNDELLAALGAVQEEASKDSPNPSQAFGKACSIAALILSGALFRAERERKNGGRKVLVKIVASFEELKVRWIMGDVKVHPAFFREWENWCQNVAASASAST